MAKKAHDDNNSVCSSATLQRNTNYGDDNDSPVILASKEHFRVAVTKSAMVLVLLAVAMGLCSATFFLFRRNEEDSFERTFESYSSEIVAVSRKHVETSFLVLAAFSNSISKFVKVSHQTWPNITIDDYTSMATQMVQLVGNGRLVFAPFVKQEDRLGFESFVHDNIYPQIQEYLDFTGTVGNATDIEGVHEQILAVDMETKGRSVEPYEGSGVKSEYLVLWQSSEFDSIYIMNNILSNPAVASMALHVQTTKRAKVGFIKARAGVSAQIMQPIFPYTPPGKPIEGLEVKGVVWMNLKWDSFFTNILPEHSNGIRIVMESSCGFAATYEINGLHADFIGHGDFHDTKYDDMEIATDFFSLGIEEEEFPSDLCLDQLTLRLYPTDTLKDSTSTNQPLLYAAVVAGIFLFTSSVFLIYDLAVRRRQNKVMSRVITQDRIVSNLFPASIRDRLYGIGDRMNGGSDGHSTSTSARDLLDLEEVNSPTVYGSKPIADLFLETTVLFADISGFTAWSSAREPSQVFILLENIYGAFDKLCHHRGVFKVETIGDCYVAVSGLPLPNKSHAIAMAKFARDCLSKVDIVTTKMEMDLGPDTGDLSMRIGLHSGQVTAGVLRGERSRFQLFGDTVNVAARMESTGIPGKIHLSRATAELLIAHGFSKWIKPRGELLIRGKGTMFTYWLETKAEALERVHSARAVRTAKMLSANDHDQLSNSLRDTECSDAMSEDENDDEFSFKGITLSKKQRLIEWNIEVLSGLLKRILAAREKNSRPSNINAEIEYVKGRTVLEEFEEIICLPKVTMKELKRRKDPESISLDEKVVGQLRNLLTKIADLYRDNAFHSFEHASHVTASVSKLLSRIVTSDTTQQTHGPNDLEPTDLAGHSYGITNDPLTQFTVVFSAIIHDADHPGVPNAQLVNENDPWVSKYKGKSLAEQNSVDLVWELLMQPEYSDLRSCIYADDVELRRFRQLLVNVVMATDIADKELGALRKARWNKAFDPEQAHKDDIDLVVNRKATIVLEHLIQASDVSHTMQHWQVYKKWNQKFFNECYSAWRSGRAEKDPSLGWYESEIGFFNYYIIPLAKKLDSCGVFGVSSHEYLNYATANLDEWEKTGQEVVKEFIKAYGT